MSSNANVNTDGKRVSFLAKPKAGPRYLPPDIPQRDKPMSEMSRKAAATLGSLPQLLTDYDDDGKTSGKLVEIILIQAGLYRANPLTKRPEIINAYPATFKNSDAFADFAQRLLAGMARWLGGRFQNDETMAALLDMALLDQDSPNLAATKARPLYHTPSYFGWKHKNTQEGMSYYEVHREHDHERRAFFQDPSRCALSLFLHHEGQYHWTCVLADNNGARMLYFDSLPGDVEADAARVRLLLAEFYTVNGHPYAKKVKSWDIKYANQFRQDDTISCGPAVAEFVRSIYREQAVGVERSSHMAPEDPARKGHKCRGQSMTDCIKFGWRDAVGTVLNIGLEASSKPLLCRPAGSPSIQEILRRTCREMGLTEADLGKHMVGGYHRPGLRNCGTLYRMDNKAVTLTNMKTGESFQSQQAPQPGTPATPSTHTDTLPGARRSSPIEIASTASGRSTSAPKGTGSQDLDMMTASMSSLNMNGSNDELIAKMAKVDREKKEVFMRREQLSPGSAAWMDHEEKYKSLCRKMGRLLDELRERNEKN